MKNRKQPKRNCPKCGSSNLEGDNLAAWCEDCDWNNFGTYKLLIWH